MIALGKSAADYEAISCFKIADGVRDYLLMASPQFFESLQNASKPDPWKFGFAIIHSANDRVIGLCGFAGPPDSNRSVEIGYSIAPEYQGKGFATEAAEALIQYAATTGAPMIVRAHTLPESNASTRVLEKCGFTKIGEVTDPEGYRVWEWEKEVMSNYE